MKIFKIGIRLLLVLTVMQFATISYAQSKKNKNFIQKSDDSFVVKGHISGVIQNEQIVLAELYNGRIVPFDTTVINMKDSTFEFKGNVKEDLMAYLVLSQTTVIPLVITAGSHSDLSMNLSGQGIQFEITGKETEKSKKIRVFLEQYSQGEYAKHSIEELFNTGQVEISQAAQYEAEYYRIESQINQLIDDMLLDTSNPVGAYFVFNAFLQDPTKEEYDKIFSTFEQSSPNSKYLTSLKQQYEIIKSTMIGEIAPNISLPTPEGDTLDLYSLRGKLVMIDFWASWCGPCRMENPNNKKMYEKYGPKGFEIYAVSLDKTRNDWVKTINNDNLNWLHVSDLAFWNSAPAKMYKVHSIPATFILDKDGRILAKDLRGKALENFLEDYFK